MRRPLSEFFEALNEISSPPQILLTLATARYSGEDGAHSADAYGMLEVEEDGRKVVFSVSKNRGAPCDNCDVTSIVRHRWSTEEEGCPTP